MFKELKMIIGEGVHEKMVVKAYDKALKTNRDYESISTKNTHSIKIKVGTKYKTVELRKL